MTTQDEVQKMLKSLPPEQQHFAQAVAAMRLENRTFRQQISDMKKAYDDLWKVMIVILHAQPDRELRIHETQFLRFKEEYRIDKRYDKETKEMVMKLLTVYDAATVNDREQ